MNIGIITPIELEYTTVRTFLQDIREQDIDGFQYEIGQFAGNYHDFSVIIYQSGSKNEEISLAAERLIRHFGPVVLLLVGIAGGVKDVKIADVVVATKAYGYESGKETDVGFVIRPDVIPYDFKLIELARNVARKSDWYQRLPNKSEATAKVFFGPIASGNKVVASTNSQVYKRIKSHFNDTIALEMEAIGFAKAIMPYKNIRSLNIRGISDLLDGKAEGDAAGWQEIAIQNAAAFAFELISKIDFKTNNPNRIDTKDLPPQLKPLEEEKDVKLENMKMNIKNLSDIRGNQYNAQIINITQGPKEIKEIDDKSTRESCAELVKEQLRKGHIKEALESFLNFSKSKPDLHKAAILLSSQWNTLQRELMLGVVPDKRRMIIENQIINSLLTAVDTSM